MAEEKIMRGRCFGQGQFNWNIPEDLRAEVVRLRELETAVQAELRVIERHLEKLEADGRRKANNE